MGTCISIIRSGVGRIEVGDLNRDSMRAYQRSDGRSRFATHVLPSCGRDVTRKRVGREQVERSVVVGGVVRRRGASLMYLNS